MISAPEAHAKSRKAKNDDSDVLVVEALNIIEKQVRDATLLGQRQIEINLPPKYSENNMRVFKALQVVCSQLEVLGFYVEFVYYRHHNHWFHVCWNFHNPKFSIK